MRWKAKGGGGGGIESEISTKNLYYMMNFIPYKTAHQNRNAYHIPLNLSSNSFFRS